MIKAHALEVCASLFAKVDYAHRGIAIGQEIVDKHNGIAFLKIFFTDANVV